MSPGDPASMSIHKQYLVDVEQGGRKQCIVSGGRQLRQLVHEGSSGIQLKFIREGGHTFLFKNQSK